MGNNKPKIGILALHGSFIEHIEMMKKLGCEIVEIRQKKDLQGINGLIIPGGESTTISILLDKTGLRDELIDMIKNGLPTFGTCAGVVLLATKIKGKVMADGLKLMDIEVERNAYGSQLDSFEEEITINLNNNPENFYAIFIRAPKIINTGENAKILGRNRKNEIVLAQENNILIATFHPELTEDTRVHEYFLKTIKNNS